MAGELTNPDLTVVSIKTRKANSFWSTANMGRRWSLRDLLMCKGHSKNHTAMD